MKIKALTIKEANEFVEKLHRHHKPVQGHKFSLGAYVEDILVGVCIVGRPVARGCDYKTTLEITRLCTDGTYNACSFLYGAAFRAAKALGYKKIQTYILNTELGTSLKASGYVYSHTTAGGQWSGKDKKPRRTDQPTCPKHCYYKEVA